jgi:HAE1 family hydrophobic/amphiphilic exporter-1
MVPALQSVLGVAVVNVSGGLQREIQVRVDYGKLAAYNLNVTQVANAISAANISTSVGSVEQGQQLLSLRSLGLFNSVDDLSNMVVTQTTGGSVLLHDVATITEGYKQQSTLQRLNGQPAVGLSIVKNSDANELQVAGDVRKALDQLKTALPDGASIAVRNDSSVFTQKSLDSVQHDLLLAVLMVGLVTLIFMHEWRHTLIIILAVPTSMISTFLIMFIMGFSLNVMTLMALALIIGILVDDSIVVLENIHRHLQMGESPRDAALNGRSEIGLAALAITMADVVVYAPIAFMSGFVGQLFRQYGLTVVAATLFSMLISFTLTPMLASRWLKHEEEHGGGPFTRFGRAWDHKFDAFAHLASGIVPVAVRGRWLVALGAIVAIGGIAAAVQFNLIGTEYAPQEDDNQFSVNISTPSGTSLATIDAASKQMEAALQQMPEVQGIFASISNGSGGFGGGNPSSGIAVQVIPKDQRTKTVFDLMNQARTIGRQIPGANVRASASSPLPGGGGGGGISVDISGPDLDTLNQVVAQVQLAATEVPGLVDLQNNSLQSTPELHIQLDTVRMAQLGITAQQVTTALSTTIGGRLVSALQLPGKVQEDITVVASDADRVDFSRLQNIPVGGGTVAAGGGGGGANATVVTLGQIATLIQGTGPVRIEHTNRNRTLSLNGTISGRPLGDVARDLKTAVATVNLPAGYTVKMGGSVNQLNNALAALGQALVLSLILEYMLLVALYESWFYPLALMFAVPLGLVGSFAGLLITGNTINMFSLIGMIMAFGLVAKNGILLVDYTNTLRKRGMERTSALREAARTRLRPILMTSSTMVAGMFPLALKLEAGAESRAPMAIVVIGAICTSTLLAILVIPAMYTLFDDLQGLFSRAFAGRSRRVTEAAEEAMPAPRPSPAPIPTRGGLPAPAPLQMRSDGVPPGSSGPGVPLLG